MQDFDEDFKYIVNARGDRLFINPAVKNSVQYGAYAKLIDDSEVIIGEVNVGERQKICVSVFFTNEKNDFTSFKITKIKYHARFGWQADGFIKVNGFQLANLRQFVEIISNLKLANAKKAKIDLQEIDTSSLSILLSSETGKNFIKKIADDPALTQDIFAISHKKLALKEFERLLRDFENYKSEYCLNYDVANHGEEGIWQHFFQNNKWIFGHGLNYFFLESVIDSLEVSTTGKSLERQGKRVDALMKTKAAVSQSVLIEIKKPTASLLGKEYRAGCWSVSNELSGGVAQIQKTAYEFTYKELNKIQLKDGDGKLNGEEVYRIQPKCYLIIGNLEALARHEDKITSFQLYRNSLHTPEILTFDELFERANCIVETISFEKSK